uniref:Secreted protein n=1 Tax=Parascaris univalens TaxID=6257 RepID=A0A914ZWZ8_PARUN
GLLFKCSAGIGFCFPVQQNVHLLSFLLLPLYAKVEPVFGNRLCYRQFSLAINLSHCIYSAVIIYKFSIASNISPMKLRFCFTNFHSCNARIFCECDRLQKK